MPPKIFQKSSSVQETKTPAFIPSLDFNLLGVAPHVSTKNDNIDYDKLTSATDKGRRRAKQQCQIKMEQMSQLQIMDKDTSLDTNQTHLRKLITYKGRFAN